MYTYNYLSIVLGGWEIWGTQPPRATYICYKAQKQYLMQQKLEIH